MQTAVLPGPKNPGSQNQKFCSILHIFLNFSLRGHQKFACQAICHLSSAKKSVNRLKILSILTGFLSSWQHWQTVWLEEMDMYMQMLHIFNQVRPELRHAGRSSRIWGFRDAGAGTFRSGWICRIFCALLLMTKWLCYCASAVRDKFFYLLGTIIEIQFSREKIELAPNAKL